MLHRDFIKPDNCTPPSAPPSTSHWFCSWIGPDVHRAHSSYRTSLIRLISAQALVMYGCSAILYLSEHCPSTFKFLPAARAAAIAGLLTQLIFYRTASLSKFELALNMADSESRSRATVFFASLWLPFMPFMVSMLFFCIGIHREACIPSFFATTPQQT